MSNEAASRWNIRYQEDSKNSFESPRALLLEHADLLPKEGLALDLAMGLGGNAGYLLQQGLRVIGVDISSTAVRKACARLPEMVGVVADLEHFYIPPNTFNVIINFFYLQRDLWLPITHGLKESGVLFIECLTEDMLSVHPEINPEFLLRSGELCQSFMEGEMGEKLDILYYREGWQPTENSHHRATASLIARRHTE